MVKPQMASFNSYGKIGVLIVSSFILYILLEFSKLIVTVSGFIYYMLAKEEINIILINKFHLIH
jgi:hypothetical protein